MTLEFLKIFKKTERALGLGVECEIFYYPQKTKKEEILTGLKKNQETELSLGFTTLGPHRDDFIFNWG